MINSKQVLFLIDKTDKQDPMRTYLKILLINKAKSFILKLDMNLN
jgi:hypothetical protein